MTTFDNRDKDGNRRTYLDWDERDDDNNVEGTTARYVTMIEMGRRPLKEMIEEMHDADASEADDNNDDNV
jgi:hypothetical protein